MWVETHESNPLRYASVEVYKRPSERELFAVERIADVCRSTMYISSSQEPRRKEILCCPYLLSDSRCSLLDSARLHLPMFCRATTYLGLCLYRGIHTGS